MNQPPIQTPSQSGTLAAACPECDATIAFDRTPFRAQVVRCTDCGCELEVTSADPITLELAPEVEEDWGE